MITDLFLENMGKALNNETFVVPGYLAYGTDTIVASPTDTVISGEIGSRIETFNTRVDAEVTLNGIRTGASVVQSTGDTLRASGILSAETGGVLGSIVALPGLIQTTSFDIETDWTIEFTRR